MALLLLCCAAAPARAADAVAAASAAALPSLAALEAAGARIGRVRVLPQNIFDTNDPTEDKWLFRWANRLHVRTRAHVIEQALLFHTGQPLSVRLIEETERLLRAERYLYDVDFRVVAWHDGVVDIDVLTRDTWSLDLGLSAGRSGGASTGGIQLSDYNLLGSGVALSLEHSRSVDRSGNELQLLDDRLFGSRVALALKHGSNSDGGRDEVSAVRPFYALDARWAAGIKFLREDRIDALYNAGNVAAQYRHQLQQGEVFGGWSAGLVHGWVRRYSIGLSLQDDRFSNAAGHSAPPKLPTDQRQLAPFVRYELVQDDFRTELNRNLIGRPEFFALGLAANVQLGWAARALGSTQDALVYSARVSGGSQRGADRTLTASAHLDGQWLRGRIRRQTLGGQLQWYAPQGPSWLFYGALAADVLTRPDVQDGLLLGGDNGLRGYPLRYQSGSRRALATVEERFYTDIYLWRLFRVGGAGFVDVGRAWGGDNINRADPGWLGDAGIGLRFVSTRSAFSNVVHVDIAFPLHAAPGIQRLQLLVKTEASF